MDLSLSFLAIAVVGTVGSIQWVKGFFPNATASWPWRVLMALLSVGWGIAIGPTWLHRVLYGLLLIALAEAGYKVVVQKLGEVAGRLADKIGG